MPGPRPAPVDPAALSTPAHRADEAKLRRRLRQIAKTHPRWGWKKAHDVLRREGWALNRKRTRRLWRQEGLRRPQICRKRRRLHPGSAVRRRAETEPGLGHRLPVRRDGRLAAPQARPTSSTSSPGRPWPWTSTARCTSDDLIEVIERLVAERGAPDLPPHGQWSRAAPPGLSGTGAGCRARRTIYIEPGSPWENPYVESFNGRVRDELLNIEEFGSLTEARIVVEAWRMEYNTWRPHSSLGGLTPVEFKRQWTEQNQPACS